MPNYTMCHEYKNANGAIIRMMFYVSNDDKWHCYLVGPIDQLKLKRKFVTEKLSDVRKYLESNGWRFQRRFPVIND